MRKKKMMLILILILAIGFASVSTTLVITGLVGISSKQSDFDVIFTNAILDDVERKDFIKGEEKQLIEFETETITELNVPTTLEYEVTNKSRLYDAKVNITCNIVDNEENETTNNYISIRNTPEEMIVRAGEKGTGRITATLIKTSTEEQDIKVKCTLNASATERTSLGEEYKEAGTYEIVVDNGTEGVADIGDEIAIGEEHFYVISKSEGKINALAKYNLNVGSNLNLVPNVTEGIQHETVKGWLESGTKYGNVKFSENNGWTKGVDSIDIRNAAYTAGPLEHALYGANGYEAYIQGILGDTTAKVRLIRKSEIEALVNEGATLSNGSIKDKADAKEYPWIYYTSYWTESADSDVDYRVWGVYSDGDFYSNGFSDAVYYGVRPLITISEV